MVTMNYREYSANKNLPFPYPPRYSTTVGTPGLLQQGTRTVWTTPTAAT